MLGGMGCSGTFVSVGAAGLVLLFVFDSDGGAVLPAASASSRFASAAAALRFAHHAVILSLRFSDLGPVLPGPADRADCDADVFADCDAPAPPWADGVETASVEPAFGGRGPFGIPLSDLTCKFLDPFGLPLRLTGL